jgi:vacuolar protein sorting-associated protein 41
MIGTYNGNVHMLDLNGNNIRQYSVHKGPVNDVCLDSKGEFAASCSDDGTVAIISLFAREKPGRHTYHRPVKTVALVPQYSDTNAMFAAGGLGQQLILNTKGWFSHKDNVIHAGEGPVHAVKWRNNLIAWANDLGVKIYDVESEERITYISRPKGSPDPNLYRCNLCWAEDDTILIGWADSVKIGVIKRRRPQPGRSDRYVEIVAMFQTDYYICGIAPFQEWLVVLAYIEADEFSDSEDTPAAADDSKQATRSALRPELRIISRTNDDISSDALPILGYQRYEANDYRLDFITNGPEPVFYIVSPKDVVIGRPRDFDDHVTWLRERGKFEAALRVAEEHERELTQHTVLELGELYLDFLMEVGDYEQTAVECKRVLKDDGVLWEKWILRFAKVQELRAIGQYIPLADPQLSDTIYEMVLNHFLTREPERFLETVNAWPTSVYNVQNVITAVIDRLNQFESIPLREALAFLYLKSHQYDRALHMYLKLQRSDVFELVRTLDLFDSVKDKVLPLMMFDQKQTIQMLIDHMDRIPVDVVMAQLQQGPRDFQHAYLHAVFQKDSNAATQFHDLQIHLYAEYQPSHLLPFLRNSQFYVLEDALAVCQQHDLYLEQVFILKRMGNTDDALTLIVEKLQDVEQAILFVEEQKDDRLWEDLIEHGLRNPKLLADLLEHVGSHYVNPQLLLRRIPNDLEIPNLKNKLVKIIQDYVMQESLVIGCHNIFSRDCDGLMDKLVTQSRSAMQIDVEQRCGLCNDLIFLGKLNGVTMFFCKHIFHTSCINNHRRDRRERARCAHPSCRNRMQQARRQHQMEAAEAYNGQASMNAVSGASSVMSRASSTKSMHSISGVPPVARSQSSVSVNVRRPKLRQRQLSDSSGL